MNETARDLCHLMNNIERLPRAGADDILSEILLYYDGVSWEIGPDPIDYRLNILAISGGGRLGILEEVEKNLNLPISGDGWKIVAGIPPKSWQGYFEMKCEHITISVEGWDWRWVETGIEDKCLKIDLYIPAAGLLRVEDIAAASDILLFGTIGEINVAKSLKVENRFFLEEEKREYESVKTLRTRFADLFPEAPYVKDFSRIK